MHGLKCVMTAHAKARSVTINATHANQRPRLLRRAAWRSTSACATSRDLSKPKTGRRPRNRVQIPVSGRGVGGSRSKSRCRSQTALTGLCGAAAPKSMSSDMGAAKALASPAFQPFSIFSMTPMREAQISLMIKALKAKKLVTQRPDVSDPRVRVIELSSVGLQLLAQVLPRMRFLQAELWPSEDQNKQLTGTIKAVLARWAS